MPEGSGSSDDFLRIISGKNRSALILAERAHRGQEREDDIPYWIHPVAVALCLAGCGGSRNQVCAALLHDAVEDSDGTVTSEYIEQEFGSEVASLVSAVTKDKSVKRLRLEEQAAVVYESCVAAGEGAVAVKAADLLCNLTDLVLDAEHHGPQHWERVFGKRADGKLDHYLELAARLGKSLPSFPLLVSSLERRANELRALRAAV
jgi:GTP pyrophosphokinase